MHVLPLQSDEKQNYILKRHLEGIIQSDVWVILILVKAYLEDRTQKMHENTDAEPGEA